jgi:hypothetical protein
MTTTWTKYVHDEVPMFGALPNGLCVRWCDTRDHGRVEDGWAGLLVPAGMVWLTDPEETLRFAEILDHAGLADVEIVCCTEDEASDVVDASWRTQGFDAVETSYCAKSGWWTVTLTQPNPARGAR